MEAPPVVYDKPVITFTKQMELSKRDEKPVRPIVAKDIIMTPPASDPGTAGESWVRLQEQSAQQSAQVNAASPFRDSKRKTLLKGPINMHETGTDVMFTPVQEGDDFAASSKQSDSIQLNRLENR